MATVTDDGVCLAQALSVSVDLFVFSQKRGRGWQQPNPALQTRLAAQLLEDSASAGLVNLGIAGNRAAPQRRHLPP